MCRIVEWHLLKRLGNYAQLICGKTLSNGSQSLQLGGDYYYYYDYCPSVVFLSFVCVCVLVEEDDIELSAV
jgi:hypothetical protein